MTQKYKSSSPAQTIEIGVSIIDHLLSSISSQSLVFLLDGPMGSGKTELTKGLARGCHIEQPILSPTYTIAREYPFTYQSQQCLFLHADLWRMQSSHELIDLNLQSVLTKPSVIVIEWASMFAEEIKHLLAHQHVRIIQITCANQEHIDERLISIGITDGSNE